VDDRVDLEGWTVMIIIAQVTWRKSLEELRRGGY